MYEPDDFVLTGHKPPIRQTFGEGVAFLAKRLFSVSSSPATVIDVGVATGTPDLYRAFPNARFLLVEPLEEYSEAMRTICTQIDGEIIQTAAGNENTTMKMTVQRDMMSSSFIKAIHPGDQGLTTTDRDVPVRRLDTLVEERNLKGPFVVKVDVQGFEKKVLEGCAGFIDQVDAFILETPLRKNGIGTDFSELVIFLDSIGYCIYDIVGLNNRVLDGALLETDTIFVKRDGILRQDYRYGTPQQYNATATARRMPEIVQSARENLKNGGIPYVTIIVCSRNDNYNGDAAARSNVAIQNTINQFERYEIESELILVDYNPPQDKPSLIDSLSIDFSANRFMSVRSLVVPPDVHQRMAKQSIEQRDYLYTIPVNAAYRRARGEFLLHASIDILLPDPVMEHIAARSFDPGCLYRAERIDVDRNILSIGDWEERLAACTSSIVKRFPYEPDQTWPNGVPKLWTAACGDFQLLARDVWHALRGYNEKSYLHCDAVLAYAAHGMGIRQEVLSDMHVYHIEQPDNFVCRTIDSVYGDTGFTLKELWPSFVKLYQMLGKGEALYDVNGDDWGLANDNLPDTFIHRAVWDKR